MSRSPEGSHHLKGAQIDAGIFMALMHVRDRAQLEIVLSQHYEDFAAMAELDITGGRADITRDMISEYALELGILNRQISVLTYTTTFILETLHATDKSLIKLADLLSIHLQYLSERVLIISDNND